MSVAVLGKTFIGQLKFPVIPELLDKSSNKALVLIHLSFPLGSFRRIEILWLGLRVWLTCNANRTRRFARLRQT